MSPTKSSKKHIYIYEKKEKSKDEIKIDKTRDFQRILQNNV